MPFRALGFLFFKHLGQLLQHRVGENKPFASLFAVVSAIRVLASQRARPMKGRFWSYSSNRRAMLRATC